MVLCGLALVFSLSLSENNSGISFSFPFWADEYPTFAPTIKRGIGAP